MNFNWTIIINIGIGVASAWVLLKLNYRYEEFEKIEDAFKVMDEKPRDLIKPIVYTNL